MDVLDTLSQTTREEWLTLMAAQIMPHVVRETTLRQPLRFRVSCGFPSAGARSKSIGECWTAEASADKTHEIFVHPKEADARTVAAILTHELLHACMPPHTGHKGPFKRAALALGFAAPVSVLKPTDRLWDWLGPLVDDIGPYPHATLSAVSAKKKQTTRLRKCVCAHCGYTVRVTQKWLDVGEPLCPNDYVHMTAEPEPSP